MAGRTKRDDQYFENVRRDHYGHKLAMLAVAAYGWQLHGGLIGVGILVGLFAIITVSNIALMASGPDHSSLQRIRINRWGWVVLFAIILVLSGSTLAEVS